MSWRGGKCRRCPPMKNHENKRFATYSSLWGAFSSCEGLSATFLLMETHFRHVGAFLLLFSPYGMWAFLLFCSPYKGFFSLWGAFLGLPLPPPPHPTKFSASTHGPCHDINLNVKFVENVFASAKGVFKVGVQGVQPPPPKFSDFFLKSEGKEIERIRKKRDVGGGGYLLTYFWG